MTLIFKKNDQSHWLNQWELSDVIETMTDHRQRRNNGIFFNIISQIDNANGILHNNLVFAVTLSFSEKCEIEAWSNWMDAIPRLLQA